MINFEQIGKDIGKLVQEKNVSYGDSFKHSGEILKFLYPNGIPPEKYTICLALVRILDKIFRLATNPKYNNENSWKDIAGYAILMLGYDLQESKDSKDEKAIIEDCFGVKVKPIVRDGVTFYEEVRDSSPFTGKDLTTKCGMPINSDIKE